MRQAFTGCGTALVTPFTRSGALDEARVGRLARRQIEAGIHFLVPCGTTGETPTLTQDERVRVVEIVVGEAKGRVPVLAGAGGYNTHEVIEAALQLARAGADGILSVAPYYNKPTPEGLYQHYKAIAEAGDFISARRVHHDLLPLMQVNFVESSPIPVKAAMAMMGLLEEVYRLPMVPPSPASRERIAGVLQSLGLRSGRVSA
jgi:dihydrodipicolinate synthase/N-acetylneuraminate lyase